MLPGAGWGPEKPDFNSAVPPPAPRRPFTFPPVERMGKVAVAVSNLTHGYNGNTLFRSADLVGAALLRACPAVGSGEQLVRCIT